MAGSLVYRTYTRDSGVTASLKIDESNAESTSGGTALLGAFSAAAEGLSRLVQPRYVNTQLSTNPLQRKKFIVGTAAIFAAISNGGQVLEGSGAGGLVWNVTSKRGEKVTIANGTDTGLTDGDQP